MLDEETLAEIDRISRFPFLSRVGQPYDGPHTAVKSWAAAEKKSSSSRWADLEMACCNRLVSLINEANRAGGHFAAVREEIMARTEPARETIARIVAANSRSISWPAGAGVAIYYAIAEFHFRREQRPTFFWPALMPIFEAGRLPCGCSSAFLPLSVRQGDFDELPALRLYVL